MTEPETDLDWSGTSDGRAARAARAALTPGERLAWLSEWLDFAARSGLLEAERARRQHAAEEAWTAGRG